MLVSFSAVFRFISMVKAMRHHRGLLCRRKGDPRGESAFAGYFNRLLSINDINDDCNVFITMTKTYQDDPRLDVCQELGLSLITNACLFGACNTARCAAMAFLFSPLR